jgi:hypothetical protein
MGTGVIRFVNVDVLSDDGFVIGVKHCSVNFGILVQIYTKQNNLIYKINFSINT